MAKVDEMLAMVSYLTDGGDGDSLGSIRQEAARRVDSIPLCCGSVRGSFVEEMPSGRAHGRRGQRRDLMSSFKTFS